MSGAEIELDQRLRAIRGVAREAAEDIRSRALLVDADPDDMERHLDSSAFALIRQVGVPAAYREPAAGAALLTGTCLENAVGTLELARGDAGVVLACPAPSLAGRVVDLLGSPEQKDLFYSRLRGGRTWTFFAMTEPGHGSDATALQTRLEPAGDGWRLYGHKRYIGNAARGGIGVVFARTGRSALSIRAALVEPPASGWQSRTLPMIGLRGAYLSEITFDGAEIGPGRLLGEHLPVTRRGMWGALQVFNAMRIQVAATAVGTALAMVDYVAGQYPGAAGADLMAARAAAARELVLRAAAGVDQAPDQSYLSSAAKLEATRMVVHTARWATAALGPAGLLEHPLLEKWTRDSCAFEFMEGTSNIQRLQVVRGYQNGEAHV